MMDAINDPGVTDVVLMTSSQVGKTEIINNVLGYHIHHDPCPTLLIQPTLEMGEAWSKDRLAPMLRDTPCLTKLVDRATSRSSGNTLRHKTFPGGHVTVAGANSPAGLASRPIRLLLGDERSRWPHSAGTEGDPWRLAVARTATFWNAKRVQVSTPTITDYCAIEREYQTTSMERYYVPCPHCGASQLLQWSGVKYDDDDPSTARYECEACREPWSDVQRWRTLRHGEWIAERPEVTSRRGFHINALYSPWVMLDSLVESWLQTKRRPALLQTFINTVLGESWRDRGDALDHEVLFNRREVWSVLPEHCRVLTAGVDVQKDRLELEVVGWDESEESWSVDYQQIWGDPHKPEVWADLDAALKVQYPRADGALLGVSACCVDSGGHHTSEVYRWCSGKQHRRIFAVKGMAGQDKAAVRAPTLIKQPYRCWLHTLGVNNIKSGIFTNLMVKEPGPGYCHFPLDRPMSYFMGLTSERLERKIVNGRERIGYVQISEFNEPLDLRTYATAARLILRPNWLALSDTDSDEAPEPAAPSPAARRPRRPSAPGNWVNSW